MRGAKGDVRGPQSCGTPAGAMAAMNRLAQAAWRTRDLFSALLCLCFIAAVLVAVFAALPAHAEETAVIRRGDAAVTAFSGVLQSGDIPKTVHPLDRTFLDTTAPVLRVLDLSKLGGAPEGQLANAPVKFSVTAGDIGQVFGVTLDSASSNQTPNIFVAATSLYGLQIVDKDGERLVKGAPGARWMPGQFGTDKEGGPGSIWKIDGATGAVSLFANIRHGGKENAGPALGALAYDPASKTLYVADLETGLIHRLSSDGVDLATFDHGVAGRAKAGLGTVPYDAKKRMSIESGDFDADDPATWGFADKRRRVIALAVEGQRLYYSLADGPQIWSVGLTADGGFADDARREIDVTATPRGTAITGIAFDGPGALYLTQRGDLVGSYDYSVFAKPQSSVVLRYTWDESDKTWSEGAEEFPIGLEPPHRATTGGLALSFGYTPSGSIDYGRCRETLWTTGEHLREGTGSVSGARNVHGLQGNAKVLANAAVLSHPTSGAVALESDFKTLAESANEAPTDAWFVDLDDRFEDEDAFGHVGAVAIFNPCDQRTAAEPTLPKVPAPGYPAAQARHLYRQELLARPRRRPHPLQHLGDQRRRLVARGPDHVLGFLDHPCWPRRRRTRHHRLGDARRARMDVLGDAVGGLRLRTPRRVAPPRHDAHRRRLRRHGRARRLRQLRLPQLRELGRPLLRHRLRRGRDRADRDQDGAGLVSAGCRLHVRHHNL